MKRNKKLINSYKLISLFKSTRQPFNFSTFKKLLNADSHVLENITFD